MKEIFKKVKHLCKEYKSLKRQLTDSSVYNNYRLLRSINKDISSIKNIIYVYKKIKNLQENLLLAKEIAIEDKSYLSEVFKLNSLIKKESFVLKCLFLPKNLNDKKNIFLEIKAGVGGHESGIFVANLMKMYTKYSDLKQWNTEILSISEMPLGGIKEVTLFIKSNSKSLIKGVFSRLQFEAGVHRVQRIPATESQGRTHTSAAGVIILPEREEMNNIIIKQNELKIDVYRSSGPGGQSVNTTDSAVRITHVPTGIVVTMQNEKSQLQNKEAGIKILKNRILNMKQEALNKEKSKTRRLQIKTVDRSERIRTYNFNENRIVDHRSGYKTNDLDNIMNNGKLDKIIDSVMLVNNK